MSGEASKSPNMDSCHELGDFSQTAADLADKQQGCSSKCPISGFGVIPEDKYRGEGLS